MCACNTVLICTVTSSCDEVIEILNAACCMLELIMQAFCRPPYSTVGHDKSGIGSKQVCILSALHWVYRQVDTNPHSLQQAGLVLKQSPTAVYLLC